MHATYYLTSVSRCCLVSLLRAGAHHLAGGGQLLPSRTGKGNGDDAS